MHKNFVEKTVEYLVEIQLNCAPPSSLRPVIADMEEENDDDAGLQDKNLPKRNQEFHAEREVRLGCG